MALTTLTAGVALWVNVDAANPDVPSRAGTADRVDLMISQVGQPDTQASTPAAGAGAITEQPSAEWDPHAGDLHESDVHENDSHRSDSHEREQHEREDGHDDDD